MSLLVIRVLYLVFNSAGEFFSGRPEAADESKSEVFEAELVS
jgi:hypothetical protein